MVPASPPSTPIAGADALPTARRDAGGAPGAPVAAANQAGVHRNTLSRAPHSLSVQRFLREAVRVIRAATDLGGDVNKALFWYRNEPLRPFGYKTPECLVAEGRSEDLLRYVISLEAGSTG